MFSAILRVTGARVGIGREHIAARRHQQDVVEREAFLDVFRNHALLMIKAVMIANARLALLLLHYRFSPMISATQIRPGMVVKFNNDLFTIFNMVHRTPGNLRGFVQVRMRNLRSGTMIEHRFSSEDRVEKAVLEEHEIEYLYDDGEYYYFMNTETFEQMHLAQGSLGDAVDYLIPQLKVEIEFYEGKPMGVELPATVDMTVMETEPGLKGATVSNVTKPAKMETGLVVQVPPFINEGEKIRVSTSESAYLTT